MRNVFIIAMLAMSLTGCLEGGAKSAVADAPSTPAPGPSPTPTPSPSPAPSPAPDEFIVPTAAPQLSFAQLSSATLYARAGEAIPLDFSLTNPTGATPECNWYMEIPSQAGFPAGIAKAQFGTVNGDCTPFVHNQTNTLNYHYWVYVQAGASTLAYEWTVTFVSSAANVAVSITDATASGTYRVYDTKRFEAVVDDKDQDGTCSWKVDGVQVSTSCVAYTISAASGTRTLLFTIADGSTSDSESWTVKPGASVTAFLPASANVANGASQAFTATLADPNSAGATCEFRKDGSVVQSGSCVYNYTGDGALHTITVEAVYGAEHSGTLSTAYAYGAVNNPVSLTTTIPAQGEMYLFASETSNVFGVSTWSDVDGDAQFEWYLNGVKTNCDTSALCSYTNVLHNGIQLDNFSLSGVVVKVILTDGQYSASKTWLAHVDRVSMDSNQPAGTRCNAQGKKFWIYGTGFESTDTISIQNQNITLTKVYVSDSAVQVELPSTVTVGSQKIRVVKAYNANQSPSGSTGSTVETAFGFVTFTTAAQYCN